jgi:predicted nucleic acid-binding protein
VILVDTSVWVDHLRSGDSVLIALLESGQVAGHPFVVGELAMGNLRQRKVVLEAMRELPQMAVASDEEVLHFVEERALFGRGIGYVDAHLLASLHLTPGTQLWTRDQRLHDVARQMDVAMTRKQ